ncbi:MAG: ABC transporter permease [Thermoplasmatota archaeon]
MKERITMSLALIKYSIKRILFSKRILAALLVLIFVASIMGYASTLEVDRLNEGSNFLDTLVLSFFLPIITMFYGSTIIRDEIEDKSITQILVSPLSKHFTYLSYYIALVISLVFMMSIVTLGGFLSFFIPLGIDNQSFIILANMLSLSIIGCIVYASLFLLLSIVLEKAIYFGLFYAFIWEGFLGSVPGRIQEFSIKHYIRSIGSELIEYGEISYFNGSELYTSISILIVVTIVLLISGILIFRNKEFP